MSSSLSHDTLERLFLQAHSHAGWQDKPIPGEMLEYQYLASLVPENNCSL